MTDKEMQKLKASLPKWDEQNEEEKKLDNELSCREMINSILIYGYLDNTIDEIYEDEYLNRYKKDISEERIKELIKEQQEDLKKSKINRDVYTDSEGVTYNSVSWYDDSDNESTDKKTEAEEIDGNKLWGIHIRSRASGAESTLKLDGKYVAFTNKDEASKCRQSMDDNNGYINNFLVNTLEDLSHVDESSLQIFDTFEEYKEYSDKVVNDFIKSEEEKHNRLEKLRDSIMYKLVDDLKDAGFNVLDVGEDAWKVKHTDFNDVCIRPDIYCYIIIDAGVSYEGRSYGSRKYSVNEDGLISTTDYNNYKPYDEYKDTIIKDIKNLIDANRRSRKEESKSLKESLGDRYEVWERYFEDGGVPDPKGELAATFDTYAEAVKYMEGLMKDPDCEAWIIDTMQEESKESKEFMDKTNFKQYVLKLFTEKIASQINAEEYNSNTGELTKICRNVEILPPYYQYRPYDNIDNDKEYGIPDYVINDIVIGLNFKRGSGSNYYNNYYNKKYGYSFIVNVSIKTTSHDIDGYVYGQVSIKNIHLKEDLNKLDESKELRKYNSRLYGVYDTEKQEYIDTGTLEDMKNEVENEKEDIEEKQEEPKDDKKDININITVKNECKEIKTENLEEESINPIINPDDRYYYDDHLWVVYLYPGAGVELIPYYVYADYEQEAFDILLPYLLENAPGLVYDVSDLEDDNLDDYISIDGNYYLDYNTRIEELEDEDKEKIEKEFFKDYKEENN